ncbi:MAG: type II secretion system protein GspG [Kiritimatiellae bacterium]|nr:type II secretion system protein GspG [Kiritimatiellia bacterium]
MNRCRGKTPDGARWAGAGGFTMIELMVVFGVIVILTGIVLGVANHAQEKARTANAAATLQKMRNALDDYKAEKGTYPEKKVGQPSAVNKSFRMTIGKHLPLNFPETDPWGTEYYYVYLSKSACQVFSCGPDRKYSTRDDAHKYNLDNVRQ